jgi:hypothetical protein
MFEWLSSEENLKRALKGLGLLAVFLAMMSYFGYLALTQKKPEPCDVKELPRRCYNVNQDACEILWKHIETDCKAFVDKVSTSATQLTGPIMSKCRFAEFDRANAFGRKSNSECNEYFKDLEGWRRRKTHE